MNPILQQDEVIETDKQRMPLLELLTQPQLRKDPKSLISQLPQTNPGYLSGLKSSSLNSPKALY